ncbi:hypothetical protein EWM64_g6427 [Hericium alpestre]|uniref:Prolyl 4-hydroxylase alpha subunit Fe(2+) 2OG dioxygenase domain-containing protein n=1 Tax=Hericium alpestre TaxID=135208 RepID=A0A4Y9ZSP9_9AGAM|nr:hypothetical protein EWM64_g6427 [Hericium alpestre]
MSIPTSDDLLSPLRDAIVNKPPYISGTLPLPSECFRLHYLHEESSNYLDLANASEPQLAKLAEACQPATFGLNRQDVLDESYRKAGKMDVSQFSTMLVPERTELVKFIQEDLLDGDDALRPMRIELYKLNVYGKDSFFKTHKDTPRSESMFGSLVIVFPTEHEGGALIVRHRGEEWTFDSARAIQDQPCPTIGFTAFFSDVDHEVSVVKAGYRVTLTYNLYYDDVHANEPTSTITRPLTSITNFNSFKEALDNLLANPAFLPSGGLLGFGLRHAYPIGESLDHVPKILKGSDAIVWRACTELDLAPKVYIMYGDLKSDSERVIVDHFVIGDTGTDDCLFPDYLVRWERAIQVERAKACNGCVDRPKGPTPVSWVVRPETTRTKLKTPWIATGNEACLNFSYGEVCIIVDIPVADNNS